jgi:hypothetical protein
MVRTASTIAVFPRRYLISRFRWRRPRSSALGPVEHLTTVVDDAAAVAPSGWPIVAPAQVVERAPLDAEELGGLVDGEKG